MDSSGRGRGRGRGWGPEGENENEPDQVVIAIQRMADLLERMVNQQAQGQGGDAGNLGNNVGNQEGEDRALERFQKFAPPKFIGGPNPDLAEGWLDRMLDIFAALRYSEERQIAFAVFQFEGVRTRISLIIFLGFFPFNCMFSAFSGLGKISWWILWVIIVFRWFF